MTALVVAAVMQWAALVEPAAARYDLDARLLAAMIAAESMGQPYVVSDRGALGLMQCRPLPGQTVAWLIEPGNNVPEGARRLAKALHETGDLRRALMAYHMGLTGAAQAGWEASEDGAAYLAAVAAAWGVLWPGARLPWERPRRPGGEKEEA